ncbi:MAG: hypothetical protein R3F59_18035 [Myxococcota bacterium]
MGADIDDDDLLAEAFALAEAAAGDGDATADADDEGPAPPPPVAPDPRWEIPPATPTRSPLPWVVAGIGGSLAIAGASMAAPTFDADHPTRPLCPHRRGRRRDRGRLGWGIVRAAVDR